MTEHVYFGRCLMKNKTCKNITSNIIIVIIIGEFGRRVLSPLCPDFND